MTTRGRMQGASGGLRLGVLVTAGALVAAGAAAAAPAAAQSMIAVPRLPHDQGALTAQAPAQAPAQARAARARSAWSTPQSIVNALSPLPWHFSDPQLAASADGQRAVLAWRRGASITVGTTADGGATWGSPVSVTGGIDCGERVAERERIASSADGMHLAVVWLCENMGVVVHVATSSDAGATWSTPATLNEHGGSTSPVNPRIGLSADGSIVTVAWTQSAYTGPDGWIQVARSVDGGQTWSAPKDVYAFSDDQQFVESLQSVVSDDGARITLGWVQMATDYADPTAVTVTSADGGASWSTPAALPQAGQPSSLGLSAAADGMRVAAIWPDRTGSASTVRTALSTDGGATWAAPVAVATGGSVRYPRITMCDKGSTAAAVWVREERGKPTVAYAATSRDGGASWAKPLALSAGARKARSPLAACSADGRRITVAFAALTAGEWRAQVRTSIDAGRHWAPATLLSPRGGDAADPQVVLSASGGRAVTAWTYSTGTRVAVQYARSPGGGRAAGWAQGGRSPWGGRTADTAVAATGAARAAVRWSAATTLFATPEGRSAAESASIATSSDGARLIAAWQGARYDDRVVWTATSATGGRTWSQPRLQSAIGVDSTAPVLAASPDGRHAALAWMDKTFTDTGSGFIAVSTSADSGTTWTPPVAVSSKEVTAGDPRVTISADGRRVGLLWSSESDRPAVMAATSSDGGASWTAPQTLATADHADIFAEIRTRLAASQDGSRLLATWQYEYDPNGPTGPTPVVAAVSSDGGQAWSAPQGLSAAASSVTQHDTAVAADGSRLVCAWSALVGEHLRVQYVASTDLGQTWSTPTSLSSDRFDASAPALTVSADGRAMSASWFASAGATESVQASASRDGGHSWSPARTLGSWPRRSTALGYGLQIAATGDGQVVVAAWTRARGRARVVQAAVSTTGGRSWGTAATLASSTSWADVAVDAARSRAVAAWIRWTETSLVAASTARVG